MSWQPFDSWYSGVSLRRAREFGNQEQIDIWESMRKPRLPFVREPDKPSRRALDVAAREELWCLLQPGVLEAAASVARLYARRGDPDLSRDDLEQRGFSYAWTKYYPGSAALDTLMALEPSERPHKVRMAVETHLRAEVGREVGDQARQARGALDEGQVDKLVHLAMSPDGVYRRAKRRRYTRDEVAQEHHELLERVEHAVCELDDLHRDVVTRHVAEGRSQQELADHYGITPSAVSSRYQKALTKLVRALDDARPGRMTPDQVKDAGGHWEVHVGTRNMFGRGFRRDTWMTVDDVPG